MIYVDDACLISPNKCKVEKVIRMLQEKYLLTDEGELRDYLGVRIEKCRDGITLKQPRIINRILEMVGLPVGNESKEHKVKTFDSPADPNNILKKDPNGKPRTQS
jgi:Reverse transcriptase (RNA-dependent DNA polymerase)